MNAESISVIRFAIRVVPCELLAIEVVKTTSAGSGKYPIEKCGQRT